MGNYDWSYTGGMGGVTSNEALIAGESYARSMSQFEGMGDWLEMSGMGQGGSRIPMESILGKGSGYAGLGAYGGGTYPGQYGGGGMGDWMETTGGQALVLSEGWAPGSSERF